MRKAGLESSTRAPLARSPTPGAGELSHLEGAIVPDAVAQAFSLLYEIAIDRAKRNGLEVVRAQVRRAICELKLPASTSAKPAAGAAPTQPALALPSGYARSGASEGSKATEASPSELVFPSTCQVVTQSSLDQIASNPQPLLDALSKDVLAVVENMTLHTPAMTTSDSAVLAASLRQGFEVIRGALSRRPPAFSSSDSWILLQPLLQAAASDPALIVVKACLILRHDSDSDVCDVPWLVELNGQKGKETAAIAAVASVGVSAALATRKGAGGTEPDPRERLRQAIRFLFMLAEKPVQNNPNDAERAQALATLRFARDLTLAAVDVNVPQMVVQLASLLEANLPTGDQHGNAIHKVSSVLIAVANYAATFDGSKDKDPKDLRQARKDVIEGLIDATTVRTNRGGEWVFSVGAPVGFGGGAQWVRGQAPGDFSRQWMAPQLEVPLGVALQQLPPGAGWCGLHLALLAIDLGQFAAYQSSGDLSRPRWDSALSFGGQVGLMVGRPETAFIVGGEFRYAPTLFGANNDLSPDSGGALRLGLFAAFYVSFLDLN